MVITKNDYLPSEEEIGIEELPLSSSVLKAGSLYFGQYCDNQSKEFMLCSKELKDPRQCINEGKEVTRCAYEFFRKLKQNCNDEFSTYHECIFHSGWKGRSMDFKFCRSQQKGLDKCIFEKMGISRPPIGFFSMVRVHKTDRPKPPPPEDHLPKPIPGYQESQ